MIQQPLLRPWCRSLTRCPTPEHALSSSHKRHAHWVPHFPRNNKSVPMRKRFPNFEASSLLIDLDAEDCHGVRAIDEATEHLPRYGRNQRAEEMTELRRDVSIFNSESAKRGHQVSQIKQDVFNPWRINDFDLLAAVLLGSGRTDPEVEHLSTARHRQDLSDLLQGNAIPKSIQDATPSMTMYMLTRQRVAWKSTPTPFDGEAFKRAVTDADSFHVLERLVTNTMQTANGRGRVLRGGQDIADKCSSFITNPSGLSVTDQLAENEKILFFVNNIIINFQRHQMGPPESLRTLASSLASDCGIELSHTRQLETPTVASKAKYAMPVKSWESVPKSEDVIIREANESTDKGLDRPSPFMAPSSAPSGLAPISIRNLAPRRRRPVLNGPISPIPQLQVQHQPEARVAYG